MLFYSLGVNLAIGGIAKNTTLVVFGPSPKRLWRFRDPRDAFCDSGEQPYALKAHFHMVLQVGFLP
jgi:hypothetical protein